MIKAPGWRWQDSAAGGGTMDEAHPTRRVVGIHEIRFDGLSDLLLRAHGCSVFDVGCNRGHVGWDFAMNGARVVHGCDIDMASIICARTWFSEHPHVESKFEVVDLEKGPAAVKEAFADNTYDIVLMIGVQHKLKRVMTRDNLSILINDLGERAEVYFGWNGYAEDMPQMDASLALAGMRRVHTSELALPDRPAAIWKRR
jgi:2-polyprenyl-3-methyl-5-hydroxy-6-metoxy-1,4-benzoquinol methylase